MSEINQQIIKLIEKINPYEEINENTQLVEEGIINSLALFGMVTDLEDIFNIEIPDEMINRDNFATISRIVELIVDLSQNGGKNDNKA